MKISEFKKLENKINNYNFNKSYKNINIIMIILSYFGNIASIFLAYFFLSKILYSAIIDNPLLVNISSIIILTGLELLKRDIFNKFSIQSLKDKTISKNVIPLLIFSLLLISTSFYSSISGAKEFSYKSKEIDQKNEKVINSYIDSLNLVFNDKISNIENQNNILFQSNTKLDEEARQLPSNWINNKTKIRSQIDKNNEQIEKNDSRIKDIKLEKEQIISKYEKSLTEKGNIEKSENSKNSYLFVIISTIIEFVILSGIFFKEFYNFKSYNEFKNKIQKDDNYQKWMLYDSILNSISNNESKVNQKLPSNKAIIDMCKVNDIIVLPKDVTNFLKLLNSIGVIKTSGPAKYMIKSFEQSSDILKKHFNII